MSERLCLVNPSVTKLQLLGVVHTVYHCCKNDSDCFAADGSVAPPGTLQCRAAEFARHARHLVHERRQMNNGSDQFNVGSSGSGSGRVIQIGLSDIIDASGAS